MLDAMTSAAAFVRNGNMDILAINSLGRALYSPMYDDPRRPVNAARFHFLDPRAHDFFPTGSRPRTPPSLSCAPKPAATPATGA